MSDDNGLIAQLLQWTAIMSSDEIEILMALAAKEKLTVDEHKYIVVLRKKYLTSK